MQRDDAPANRKTQATSPFIVGLGPCQPEKALEDAFAKFRRYSRTLIVQAYTPQIAVEARAQSHPAAVGRDVECVGQQIEQNPAQPSRLNENAPAACVRAHELHTAMLRKHARVLAENGQNCFRIMLLEGQSDLAGFGA